MRLKTGKFLVVIKRKLLTALIQLIKKKDESRHFVFQNLGLGACLLNFLFLQCFLLRNISVGTLNSEFF